MADKLLKSADQADAWKKSKEKSDRLKKLHEALTEKYKFNMSKGYDNDSVLVDIDFVKRVEKKLTLTEIEDRKLNSLFFKYRI